MEIQDTNQGKLGFSQNNLNFLSRVREKHHLLNIRQMEKVLEG